MTKNSIAFRLLIAVLIVSLNASLLITAIRAWLDYRMAMSDIGNQLKAIEAIHLPVIRENLWVMDEKTVRAAMRGLLNIPHLKRILIEDHGRVIMEAGNIETEHALQREFPLFYTYGDKTIQLGNMKIDMAIDEVYKELWGNVKTGLFYTVILVFLIAFSIYFLFQMLLTRHLSDIASYIKQIEIRGFEKELLLERKKTFPEDPDEIDRIVSAINSMRLELNNTFDGLRDEIKIRKQAEEALAQRERYYRTLIFSLHEDILVIDRNYRITDINNTVLQTLGKKRDEVLGRHCYEVSHRLDVPCHEHGEQCGLRSVFDTGEYCNLHHEHISPDGKKMHIDIAMSPMKDKDGNLTHVVEAARDVTELFKTQDALRESERKYRQVVDYTPDLLYRTDMKGRITFISPSVQKLSGYTVEEAVGIKMAEEVYANPEEREIFLAELQKNGYVENFETKLKRKDGSIWWASTNAHVSKNKNGNVQGVEGITRDITKLKEAEEEQKALKAHLQQAQKMESIGTLAGGIAHDFNNILSPIMIHSEMAKMELPPDSPVQHNLREIYKAGERARDMVKQILTFSRKREGKRAELKITPVIKEALKLLRSTIPTTIDIQQNMEVGSDIVLADPTQIHQIVLNLGTNAAHAMKEKGGTLAVSLVQEDLDSEAAAQHSPDLNPGSYLKLTVSDTGSGIDRENMERIFEPYFTTKEVGEGTGMGLAVIHGIVKRYGGDITVESELGKGTTFNIYLPRIEADVTPVEEPSVQIPGGAERILFVDDERVAVDAIQPMLENLGYNVTARTSSTEALNAFKNDPNGFDLVITDQTMPNMTGKDLAQKMMSIRPAIPIILCTGYSDQIDKKSAEEMGIRSFIMKPIVMGEMAHTIREILGS